MHVCVHTRVVHLGDVDSRGLLAKFLVFVLQYLLIVALIERPHMRQQYVREKI